MKYNLMSVVSLSRLGVGCDLKSGDGLEVHHLQHLLGFSINLDDVLGKNMGHVQLHKTNIRAMARGTIAALDS